jgi:serine protease Do
VDVTASDRRRLAPYGVALALPALLLPLAVGCATTRPLGPSREEVLRQILPASVQIIVERGGRRFRSASGTVIAAEPTEQGVDCYVLTSGHTFALRVEGDRVSILLDRQVGPGTPVPATVLAVQYADRVDLALLRMTAPRCAVATVGDPPALGEDVFVVTFPWGRNMTLAGGLVSQVNHDEAEDPEAAPRLMIDASVSYGASGGGVYEARTGRLIGLIEGYRTAHVSFEVATQPAHLEIPVPGETYVTPLAQIRRFLDSAGYGALLRTAARP